MAGALVFALLLATRSLPAIAPPSPGERILVIAPHVDDEAIGAAGLIADAVRRKALVFVVYVTAGDCNRTSAMIEDRTFEPGAQGFLEEGETRLREGRSALALLGIPDDHIFLLGYPDRGLLPMWTRPDETIVARGTRRNAVPYASAVTPAAPYTLKNLERDLATVMERVRPATIIAPADFDHHPDHRVSAWATAGIAPAKVRWLAYLIHQHDFPQPFLLLPRRALQPPKRDRAHAWGTYPLSPGTEAVKHRVLERYHSQRVDPYLFLLTDAFVRTNELFVSERPAIRGHPLR